MANQYYSKGHYRLVSPAKAAPEEIAYNIKARQAGEQAYSEMKAKFPILTSENAAEAIAFQERRMKELLQS